MAVETNPNSMLPVAFRFKDQGLFPIAIFLVSVLFSFIAFLVINSSKSSGIVLPSLAIFVPIFFFYISVRSLCRSSAIVVSDRGISRRLFGWVWQRFEWAGIDSIVVVPFYHPSLKKKVRIITILSRRKSVFGSYVRMIFIDEAVNMDDLTRLINEFAATYHIGIWLRDREGKVSIPSL